jgi:hypothetical protein
MDKLICVVYDKLVPMSSLHKKIFPKWITSRIHEVKITTSCKPPTNYLESLGASKPMQDSWKFVIRIPTMLKMHSNSICELRIPKICCETKHMFQNLLWWLFHQRKGNLHSSIVTWRWWNKDNSFHESCNYLHFRP